MYLIFSLNKGHLLKVGHDFLANGWPLERDYCTYSARMKYGNRWKYLYKIFTKACTIKQEAHRPGHSA